MPYNKPASGVAPCASYPCRGASEDDVSSLQGHHPGAECDELGDAEQHVVRVRLLLQLTIHLPRYRVRGSGPRCQLVRASVEKTTKGIVVASRYLEPQLQVVRVQHLRLEDLVRQGGECVVPASVQAKQRGCEEKGTWSQT